MKTIGKWLMITLIATGLVFGATRLAPSFAQETTQPAEQPALDPATSPMGPGMFGPGRHGGPRGHHGPRAEMAGKGLLIKHTAELSGLDHHAVAEQLRAGATLTEIATANDSSEQAVIDAALADLTTRLDTAVTNGRITAEERDTALERARTEAPTLMNEAGLDMPGPGGHHGQRGGHHLVEATAAVTGLTAAEVRAEVEAGKSLAQIAQENGKSTDDIIAHLRAEGEARLDTALEHARERIEATP